MSRLDVRVDLRGIERRPMAGWLVLVLGAAVLAWQGVDTWQESVRLTAQRAGLGRLQRVAAGPLSTMTPQDVQRHQAFEGVARHLAMPWPRLLDRLEAIATPEVLVSRLRPDALSGRIELAVQARDAASAGRWLQALAEDGQFAELGIQRHDWKVDRAGAPLEITLDARWNTEAGLTTAPSTAASVPTPARAASTAGAASDRSPVSGSRPDTTLHRRGPGREGA